MIKIVNNKKHVKQTLQVTGDDDGGHTRMPRGLKRLKRVKRAGQKGLKWGLSRWVLGNEETKGFKRIHRDFTGCHSLHLHMHSAHTNTQMQKQTHKHIKHTHTHTCTNKNTRNTHTHIHAQIQIK